MLSGIFPPLLVVVMAFAAQSAAFSLNVPTLFVRNSVLSAMGSEFSLTDEDDILPGDQGQTVSDPSPDGSAIRSEYGALPAGTVVQVQVGDLSLARKAWKKRRRTGSPLLVPCSILNVDQRSMVRWNLIFLLEKFGQAQADGIQISASELSQSYRRFLKSSLQASKSLPVRRLALCRKLIFFLLLRNKQIVWDMSRTKPLFRICSTRRSKNPMGYD
jgi:hypothetical protein